MTRKKRLLQRIIALVLIAALWWQTDSMRFFVTAYAAETENVVSENTNLSSDSELSESNTTDVPVTVLGEVETLRTEGEKHFRMSDGSFMAVSYGMPVHYQDEAGEWQDIDNRMVLSKDQATYQTYNLQSTTNFSSSLTEGILFETSYDDTSVTMSLLDTIEADNLMKGEIELEIESELETEIELEEVEIEAEPDIEVEIETETESEFEIETEPQLEESTIETELETEDLEQTIVEPVESTTELEQSNEALETELDYVEEELQTETQVFEQEIIAETVNPDLLVFDRTAVADTTVEVQDVLGSISDVSQVDNKDKGWTMEDILPENIQDSLLYEDVFPGVDLLYTKYSHNVKEQIIVNSAQAAYRYDFMLTLDGVEAVLNEDGSVSLVQEENLENEIYYIPAPFMQDADGIVSYDVEYMLTDVSEGVILTVVADAEWMNAKERAFPVAIDPTIIVSVGEKEGDIYAVYTAQGSPNSSYNGNTFYAGYTEWHSMKEYRAFLYFNNLPEIPAGMTVVDAQLHLYLCGISYVGYTDIDFGIYPVTSSKPSTVGDYKTWINSLTWNTMPTYDTQNMIDYTNVSLSTQQTYHYWDITELVKKWYIEDTQNKTVALTMVPGTYNDTHYVEAQFATYKTTAPPVIAVSYRSTVGIEPYYTYQTMGVGNAGTAYIADATGHLKIVNPLVTFASTVNPFSLSLVYNSDYFTENAALDYQPPTKMGQENVSAGISSGNITMKLGQGWTLDIIQTMHTETIGDTMYLCYTDGDGTKHYFVKDDKKNNADDSNKTFYYDEDGLGLKAEITNTQKTNFIMYDDNGNRWTFTNGRLNNISDESGYFYSITYDRNNKISAVGQVNANVGVTIVATFAYSGDYVSTITDAAGNIYSFNYTDGKLTGISRNGEQTALYNYGAYANRITEIKDIESGYKMSLGYRYNKVAGVQENVNGIFGVNFGISYPNYSKTVYTTSSDEGILRTSYLFDYWGRTVNAYVTDEFNNILGASNAVYTDTQAETTKNSVSKKTNRTEKIGGIGISNPSLLTGGDCESAGWAFQANTIEGHSVSYDNTCRRTGNFSLKMVSENTEGIVYASVPSLNLKIGETYTLSAYVRTSECENFTGEGIGFKIADSAGGSRTRKCLSYATSSGIDDGWTRIHTTFTALVTGAHTISIYAVGVIGTFYVDDVQLEKGETAGTLNLLKNVGYELGTSLWSGNYIASSASGGWNRSQAIMLTGHPDNNAYASQSININLPATETFVLSGWAMGNSVPDNVTTHSDKNQDTQKQFGLRAKITYIGVTTPEYHYVAFNPDVNEWQFASLSIVPKDPTKTISTIQVTCVFGGNANVAYFDNISLCREVAQTMRYDDDGNLEAVNTPGLNKDTNTFEGSNLIRSVTGGNGTYTYTYDDTYEHRLTSVTDGVVTQNLSYDQFGNTVGTTLKSNNSNNPLRITSSATYSDDGNRITSLSDSAGNQVEYEYGNTSSKMYALPTTTTDGRGNSTATAYDSYGRTTEVEVPELVSISYAYEQGLLTSIEREDIEGESTQEYRFTYDDFGRTTAVYIGNRLLASYAYRNTGEMISMTYANGTTVEYVYDILGRVIKETFKSGNTEKRTVEYTYDNNGQINSIKDSVSGTENYVYDRLGRVVYYENEETDVRCSYTYDKNSRLMYTGYDIEDLSGGSERYFYNSNNKDSISDGILTNMQMITALNLSREFDYLQRLIERSLLSLTENYTYVAGESENTTTTLVSSKQNTLNGTLISDFEYLYDENGNITRIMDDVTNEVVVYYYDELNQLIRASHSSLRTEIYNYDAHGNLLTFNNGITSHTYTYGNNDWKDLLTAVDGVSLTYDEIGNPLTYYNGQSYSLNWTEGRKLATITTGGKTTGYLYDANGNRIKKTNSDGSYIIYVNANGVPLGEKHYSKVNTLQKTLRYIYDENGSVCGYTVSNEGTYHFIKNLQGDVIRVYRLGDNAIVASYSYDSWGNIISATGEKAEENPFRYRGYYYDAESGFYYVSSRYYDSEIGRFINADTTDVLNVSTTALTDKNLYAYCDNNPVMRKDTNGAFWETAIDVVSLCVSVAEVMANPADPWAWAGLAGDAIDLIPFVTGVGELTKVAKVTVKAMDASDDVIKATRRLAKSEGIKKFTGSYEIMFESGKNYVGKGGLYRSTVSAKLRSGKDRVTSISWTPSSSTRNAYISEYNMMKKNGVKNSNTYNKIWSPGRSILQSIWTNLFGR